MRPIGIPPAAIMPVIGRAFTTVSGGRRVEYADAAGNIYVCFSDGGARRWYKIDKAEPPAGEDQAAHPSKES